MNQKFIRNIYKLVVCRFVSDEDIWKAFVVFPVYLHGKSKFNSNQDFKLFMCHSLSQINFRHIISIKTFLNAIKLLPQRLDHHLAYSTFSLIFLHLHVKMDLKTFIRQIRFKITFKQHITIKEIYKIFMIEQIIFYIQLGKIVF